MSNRFAQFRTDYNESPGNAPTNRFAQFRPAEDSAAPENNLALSLEPEGVPTTDGPFGFGLDQAQKLMGRGAQALGGLTGIDAVESWGRDVVEAQEQDMLDGGYQSKYKGSFLETISEDGVFAAPGWIAEKTAENWATTGFSLVGGLAAAATAPFSVPAALTLTGVTLGGSYLMSTGEVAEEMDEKGLDENNALAAGGGALIALLDRFGASKVVPKSRILSITGNELIDELQAKGFQGAANAVRETIKEAGEGATKSLAMRAGTGALTESATEAMQEGIAIASAASQGAGYTGEEVLNRMVDAGVVAAPLGAGFASVPGSNSDIVTEEQATEAKAYLTDRLVKKARGLRERGRISEANALDERISALGGKREYELDPEDLGVDPNASPAFDDEVDIEYDPMAEDTGLPSEGTPTYEMPSTATVVGQPEVPTAEQVLEDAAQLAEQDSVVAPVEAPEAAEIIQPVIEPEELLDDPARQLEIEQAEAERMTRGGVGEFVSPEPDPVSDPDRFEYVEEFEDSRQIDETGRDTPTTESPAPEGVDIEQSEIPVVSTEGPRFNVSRPYENAPDSLMGFKSDGKENTPYEEQNYKFEQRVRVTTTDGQTFTDAIKGLNKVHAIERARRNWEGAEIVAIDAKDSTLNILSETEGEVTKPLPKIEIEAAVQSLRDEMPRVDVEIVDTEAGLPYRVFKALENRGFSDRVDGLFNPDDGKVYLIADKIGSREQAVATFLEESVGHRGLRETFGEELDRFLRQVARDVPQDARDDIAERYKLDLTTDDGLLELADEYVSKMARTGERPKSFQRLVAAIRRLLRRMGLDLQWTDNDIASILEKNRRNLAKPVEKSDNGGNEPVSKNASDTRQSEVVAESERGDRADGERARADTPRSEVSDERDESEGDSLSPDAPVAEELPKIRLSATDTKTVNKNPQSPKAIAAKVAAVREAVNKQKRNPLQIIQDLWENKYSGFLGTIPRRYLVDFAEKSMTGVKRYLTIAQRMDAQRNKLLAEHAGVADQWMKLSKDEQTLQADVMHEATINAYDPDPDVGFAPLTFQMPNSKEVIDVSDRAAVRAARKKLERAVQRAARGGRGTSTAAMESMKTLTRLAGLQNQRKKAKPRLDAMWAKMTPEAQDIYRRARDAYKLQHKRTLEALERRIQAAEEDANVSSGLLQELRREFENRQVEGPYFPLARFGDHWALVKDGDGNIIEFQMFENPSEQKSYLEAVSKIDGIEIFSGTKADSRDAIKEVDPGFAARVTDMAKKAGGPQGNALADDIWQLYLRTLPEMSARKSSLHRNKVRGYDQDALRAFTSSMFHGAHQLARLQYQWQLETELEKLRKQSNKAEDKNKAKRLYEELVKRHEWAMSPFAAPWATKATSLGFVWYLGATPAAALVNITQTPMIAGPILWAKHGKRRTIKELARASREFAGVAGQNAKRRVKGKKLFLDHADKQSMAEILDGDELLAFEHAVDSGTFEKTQSHDLAGIADAGENYSGWQYRVMERVAAMFHNAEVFNREVTYMAAYRLARADGLDHRRAITQADNVVWDAHFDYGSTNRPRFMQNDFAKVALLFKQHSLNMTYRLARDFQQSIKGASPAVRKEARTRFVGILTTTFMMAGLTGMPLWSAVNFILSSIIGDEDEPFDLQTEMRVALADQFGTDVADIIMKGAADKVTGAAISSRVSLNNLWFRDPETRKEGNDLVRHYMAEALGPVYKAVENAVVGGGRIIDGQGLRGVEPMVPKAIRDLMKSSRYMAEGATNMRGDAIQEEFTAPQLLYQLLGFTPAELAMRYEQNNALKSYEAKILDRRATLLNDYAMGIRFGDTERLRRAQEQIQEFNKVNRSIAITQKVINRSLKSRQRYTEESRNGINLNKNLMYLSEELDFTNE